MAKRVWRKRRNDPAWQNGNPNRPVGKDDWGGKPLTWSYWNKLCNKGEAMQRHDRKRNGQSNGN